MLFFNSLQKIMFCWEIVVGRVAELADAKDLGSFGAILAGSTPVAPTNKIKGIFGLSLTPQVGRLLTYICELSS